MSAKQTLPTPESVAKYVRRNAGKMRRSLSMAGMNHPKSGQEVVREDDYKGHHIEVRTVYKITVDGKEVTGHIMLTNAGQVQYHGLPNYTFDSTVDLLVRALIDNFPEDFEKKKRRSDSPGMDMDARTKPLLLPGAIPIKAGGVHERHSPKYFEGSDQPAKVL